jgi:Zn-dependent peptidase ImmA (M78 family)
MMRVVVKPEMFRWACERAGVGLSTVARRIPQLSAWERGEKQPTLKQLESFANVTHTPVGYFFLSEPPTERIPIPDFRTLENVHIHQPSPDLIDTLYLCQQRQEWYRDFAQSMGEIPLQFVGSVRTDDDQVQTAARIRRTLHFEIEERRRMSTWTDALRHFIEQADLTGVLIMVSGVVGSNNRRKLDPREFRGFTLADNLAPLVFVNGADTKAAQIFTLAHELVHIWLGQSAISDVQPASPSEHEIERWCNQVAAELLVPMEFFRTEFDYRSELRSEVERLAHVFKVSTLVILRRIYDAGGLSQKDFWAAYNGEIDRLRKMPKGKGGDFYLTLGARASKRFARALVISTLEGRSSFTEAFRLLGLKKMTTFRDLGRSLGLEV